MNVSSTRTHTLPLAVWLRRVILGLAAIALSTTASAAQVTATWIGPSGNGGNGNWGVAANWSPAVVPNNGTPSGTTYRVVIDNSGANSVVTIPDNGTSYTIDALSVSAGDTLSLTFSAVITVVNTGPGTGTIVNAGNIALGTPGFTSPGILQINGNVTLSGGGTVTMINTPSSEITGTGRLTNVDNTIQGTGTIGRFGGGSTLALTNQSLIVANQSTRLLINSNPNSGGVSNTGTFRAEAGSTLTLDTNSNLNVGSFDNAGGLIRANGGIVRVNLSTVTGGTVDVVGAGEILLAGGTVRGGTLTNSATGIIRSRFGTQNTIGGAVTNPPGGLIIIERAGGSLTLLGGAGNSYSNAGDIVFGTGSGEAALTINGDVSLTGGGTLTMGNINNSAITGSPSTSLLTNVDNTISGAGQVGGTFGTSGATMRLTNQATIIANQTNNLVIKATPPETGFTTSGTVQVNSGSTMVIDSSTVFTQTGGTALVNGTLSLNGGTLQLQGGTLGGAGTIGGGAVNNTGGTVAPGVSPGKLTINGAFTQEEDGTLAIEIAGLTTPGTDFDLLAINGAANLGGALQVTNINGFTPAPSDTVVPLTASAISGAFDTTNTQVDYGSASITVAALPGNPPRLLNLSTRLRVQTGANALIGGFIIIGTVPKKVILRAIGPSLSGSGVPGALADPTMELRSGAGALVASNNNWRQTQQAEIIASNVPPSNDLESAIVATLEPGDYTAIVRGQGNTSGVGLVEIYDLEPNSTAQLADISTRGFVEEDDNVMIGGFIVGPVGSGQTRVIVRAIGPDLTARGVPGALQDTTLELFNANGMIASNDDWRSTQEQEIIATTVPPNDNRESAIVASLTPGGYTAIVRGAGGTTGVALVEVFILQ